MDVPAQELDAMVSDHAAFVPAAAEPPPPPLRPRMHKKGPNPRLRLRQLAVAVAAGGAPLVPPPMAAAGAQEQAGAPGAEDAPTGPPQHGMNCPGQYVYWISMPHPKPETVARLGLRLPSEFSREAFSELLVKAHAECDVDIVETVTFLEPHASGLPHQNLLVRCLRQYRWKKTATHLLTAHKVLVNFGDNIRSMHEGVVYGCVASGHKPPEALDQNPVQWAKPPGTPCRLQDFIPRKWQAPGFVRQTRMTALAFYDQCKEHGVASEKEAWELAADLDAKGDRGCMAFM